MTEDPAPLEGVLSTITESNAVPKSRLSTASAARSLLSGLVRGDYGAAIDRTRIQSMIDGLPPNTQAELDAADQGNNANMNHGGARARIRDYLTAYTDLVTSPDTLPIVRVRDGDPQQRASWGQTLSEQFNSMLFQTYADWNFLYHMELHHKQLAIHGIGPCFWRDKRDWRFTAMKRRNILVPKESPSDISRVPIVFVRDWMYVDEVYAHIRDKDRKGSKWNRQCGYEAIKHAQKVHRDKFNWEAAEQRWQDNAYDWSYNESDVVLIAHVFTKEFDGRVSHQIFTENSTEDYKPVAGDSGYLYSDIGSFEHTGQAVWCCFQDVGNGDFESVRGYGMEAYQFGVEANKLNNSILDNAIVAGATMITADTPEHAEKITRIEVGPWRVFPPGYGTMNVSNGAGVQAQLAVLNHFSEMEENNTGVYRSKATSSSNQARTATEVEAEVGNSSRLNNASVAHYCAQGDNLLAETFRRATKKTITEKDGGGKAALEMKRRCIEAGIPEEIYHQICEGATVTMARPIGNGSYADRVARYDRMTQHMGDMPDRKRKQFVRDKLSQIAGSREAADLYGPDIEKDDPGIEQSLAILENNGFMGGGTQDPFSPDNAHVVHLNVHLPFGVQLMQGDPQKAAAVLQMLGPHIAAHLHMLKDDPTRKGEYDQFSQQFADFMKMADKTMAQAQMAAQSQQQAAQPSPEMAAVQADAATKAAATQADIARKDAKTKQQLDTTDVKTAHKLKLDQVKHEQQMAIQRDTALQQLEIQKALTAQTIADQEAKREAAKKAPTK